MKLEIAIMVVVVIAGYFAWQRFTRHHEPPRPELPPPARIEAVESRPAPPQEPPEPQFDDWSGVYTGPETALLWLTHSRGRLDGRYDPPGERVRPCRFTGGRVQGNTASCDLTM
jgi:hypothetical protein